MIFKKYWSLERNQNDVFKKSSDKLSKSELVEIQNTIYKLQQKGYNANKIIKYLQDHNEKLSERYKAERTFFTELKNLDTKEVLESADYLDLEEFNVILSPHACPICRKKTDDGNKVFSHKELSKDGYGHRPPFHANCYCILVPR